MINICNMNTSQICLKKEDRQKGYLCVVEHIQNYRKMQNNSW